MPQDTHRKDAAKGAESLEDLVYRPRLSAGNRQVRRANALIAVPATLLGYLVLGLLGWQLVRHSRVLVSDSPKSVAVDLLDTSEREAPQATTPAAPLPVGGPPPGAIEQPNVPTPPSPANPDMAPEKAPTALPTQDLSGVAFPSQPMQGSGTNAGPGAGEVASSGTGTASGLRVVGFEFGQVEVRYQPKLDYPDIPYRAGIQGTVKVSITVGLDGIPISAKAFEGPPILRGPAESYAMKWRFKPQTESGMPVLANFNLTVVFKLK
jgi:TonB family protein